MSLTIVQQINWTLKQKAVLSSVYPVFYTKCLLVINSFRKTAVYTHYKPLKTVTKVVCEYGEATRKNTFPRLIRHDKAKNPCRLSSKYTKLNFQLAYLLQRSQNENALGIQIWVPLHWPSAFNWLLSDKPATMFQHSFIFCFSKTKTADLSAETKVDPRVSTQHWIWCMQKSVATRQVMKFSADQRHCISKQRFEFLVFLKLFSFRKASLKLAKIILLQLFIKQS